MSLTVETAGRYIDSIRTTQSNEQLQCMALRRRGVNSNQMISPFFPILIRTLQINQNSQVLNPSDRDKIIDFLTP